jgi:hypothetical protein
VSSFRRIVIAAFAAALPACADSGPPVRELLDEIRSEAGSIDATLLPRPERYRAVTGESRGSPLDPPPRSAARERLVAMGSDAVPELARLLEDPERGPAAADVLREIGGAEAARAMWNAYRPLLRGLTGGTAFVVGRDPDGGEILSERWAQHRATGACAAAMSQLADGLSWSGGPVVEEMAVELGRLLATVEALEDPDAIAEERWAEDGAQYLIGRPRDARVLQAQQLIRILAYLGDERAAPVLVAALQSRSKHIQDGALRVMHWFASRSTIPALAPLLDSDEPCGGGLTFADRAAKALVAIEDHRLLPIERATPVMRENLREGCRERFAGARSGAASQPSSERAAK